MNYLEKSMERSRALVATAHEQALQLKAAGLLGGALGGSPLMGIMGDWQTQSKNRAQYAQFRGWLYAAINVLASEAASQPVCIGRMEGAEPVEEGKKKRPKSSKSFYMRKMTTSAYSKAAATELEVIDDHPLLKSLEQPNPYQHRWQFVYSFVANLCLTGWAYIAVGKEKDGQTEFYSLPTTWVIPNHSKGPFSSFKIVNPAHPETSVQDAEELSRDQVMFAHLPNPSDPLSALSPVSTQIAAIRIDDHIQTSQERFFENGIFPGVIVTVGKDPHPDVQGGVRPRLTGGQRRQVIGAIRKVMGGIANYGNPAIVDGLIESIERLSMTQTEMGWEKSEDKVRTRILSAFGVHPYILGEAVSVGGYAQVAKIEERFCKRVNTYLDMLGTVMTNFAGNMEGAEPGLMIWWEKTEPHDPSLYWQNVNAARGRDDISQNEYRALLGFAPDEDRNESVIGTAAVSGIIALLAQVGAGVVSRDQAKALMVGMGLPDELAEKVAGVGEAKETLSQATDVLQEAVRSLKASPAFLADQIIGTLKTNLLTDESGLKYNPHHDDHGRFATGGGGGADEVQNTTDFVREDWLGKPFMERRDEWKKLPIAERDRLADAPNSVPRRMEELLETSKSPSSSSSDSSADVKSRVDQFKDKISNTSATRIGEVSNRLSEHLVLAGVNVENARQLTMNAVDHLVAQEIEATGRTLGDHGINHIAGDIDVALKAMDATPQSESAQDRAALMVAAIYHDVGYMTPPSQIFLDEGHPRWSTDYYNEKIKPMVAEAMGNKQAEDIALIIRTHDAKDIDWTNEPVATAMRIGDNAALFHKEKLPPLLRDIPENLDTLSALGRKEISSDEAKSRMRASIKKSDVSDTRKQRMMNAVDEITSILPKLTLGMLGGELGEVEWKGKEDGHLVLHLKERPEITDIQKVGDFGQEQFAKFAKTYDVDPVGFKKDLGFVFKSKGRIALEGIWDKVKAIVNALRRKGLTGDMTESAIRDVVLGLVRGKGPEWLSEQGLLLRKAIEDMMYE